jgi:cytochrome P450
LAARGPVLEGDLRELQGMAPDATNAGLSKFVVFGYDEIKKILSDTDTFSVEPYRAGIAHTFGAYALLTLDPPEHTHYRRIFQKAFLPHMVAGWVQEFIDPAINHLLDRVVGCGRCDLMAEFMALYPFEIIYRQLQLPPRDAEVFHRMSVALTLFMADFRRAREAHDKLGVYFKGLIEQRRRNPAKDLISVLASTEVDGEYLMDEVLISFLRQLMNAAGDTTYRSTGSMMVALLSQRPDQFEMLKKDRSLIPRAVEETLRWEGPVNVAFRTAKRDVELCGVKISTGSFINCVTGVASRDPAIYPDPDQFDMMRPHARVPIAFGAGNHICLGQHLARLEMTRALNLMLDRLPKLRLDPDCPAPQIRGNTMRTPRHLHVLLD